MSRCDGKAGLSLWRRWLLIGGMLALGGATLLLVPVLAQPRQFEQGWGTFFSEDFEGDFPGSWIVTDTSTTDGGEYYWGTENFTYTSPITGVWCVGGGAQGSSLVAGTDTYTNNVDSWLIYGPVTLSHVFDARLEFDWWLDAVPAGTELDVRELRQLHRQTGTAPASGDWFGWCATTDISDLENACQGTYVSGRIGAWISGTLSLKQYALSQTPVWLVFHFTSDNDGVTGRGAFLDNVVLRVNHGYKIALPLVREDPTPTPTPTPTPSAYYDDFSDSGSGWPDDKGLIWYEEGLWDVWWRRGYRASEGQYRIKIDNGPAPVAWFWQPDALAPYSPPGDKYCVETSVKFNPPYGWWANGGLVFGANEDNTDIYALCLGVGAEPHLGWFLLRNPGYEFPRYGCAYVQGKIAEGEEGTDYYGWNRLQVSVNGDKVEVYVGGIYVGKWTMPGLSATTRVGVIGGDYEVSDNDIRFDYFRVIPNASCTP